MAVANKTAIALDKAISNRKKYLNTFNNLKKRNEKGLFTLFFIFRHWRPLQDKIGNYSHVRNASEFGLDNLLI